MRIKYQGGWYEKSLRNTAKGQQKGRSWLFFLNGFVYIKKRLGYRIGFKGLIGPEIRIGHDRSFGRNAVRSMYSAFSVCAVISPADPAVSNNAVTSFFIVFIRITFKRIQKNRINTGREDMVRRADAEPVIKRGMF